VINGEKINVADEQVIMTDSEDELQIPYNKLNTLICEHGTTISRSIKRIPFCGREPVRSNKE
jgi:hypothetical protein